MRQLWLLFCCLLTKVKSEGEPMSDVDIFHTWDAGLEGVFFVSPPEHIEGWVIHVVLNQPVDVIEVIIQTFVSK